MSNQLYPSGVQRPVELTVRDTSFIYVDPRTLVYLIVSVRLHDTVFAQIPLSVGHTSSQSSFFPAASGSKDTVSTVFPSAASGPGVAGLV